LGGIPVDQPLVFAEDSPEANQIETAKSTGSSEGDLK
jgi:hypothetical protein